MSPFTKPELLSPAGNLEKLKIALSYGADAVYIGGHVFGLRKYADNFSLDDMAEGIAFARSRHKKVYVVLNGFAHQEDLDALDEHLQDLEQLQPHGLIISDMGVLQFAKEKTTIPLHVSTQASVTNKHACQFWKDAGASRVILAREVSVSDCKKIKEALDIELEIFVHGAMCASYSGKCVISNYTAGRDSNRGGCVQSCRHTYDMQDFSAHIMNAKDLMGIRMLPDIIKAGIESIKIEGRMKSNLYAANASSVYRKAIDWIFDQLEKNPDYSFSDSDFIGFEKDLSSVSNRTFSSGGLDHRPHGSSIAYDFDAYAKDVEFIGTITHVQNGKMFIEVKHGFRINDSLQVLTPNGERLMFTPHEATSVLGETLDIIHPNTLVVMPIESFSEPLGILVKPLPETVYSS